MDIVYFNDYLLYAAFFIAVFLSWYNVSARWFLALIGILETLDFLTLSTVLTWHTHFYIWCASLSLLFLIPMIFRTQLANWLYQKTGVRYFLITARIRGFSLRENILICVFIVAIFVNLVTYIEVLLYKYSVLDNAIIKLYIRDNVAALLHYIEIGIVLSFILCNRKKSQPIEHNAQH
ncbi:MULTISPECIES: hypothetical protein [unclassified Pseudoalteromonas]|uniref:hypothetical protein n=1 Tax=unclassified Pseudoalteromonas TaxID=194690 RepID=UPI002097AD20|nr:hypothetical protein [Pseudoalteromonas sp. XMcav2-N]MCO7191297.1 hypothetical protein [Pseudoalteromonas sp. XMcav2-N]